MPRLQSLGNISRQQARADRPFQPTRIVTAHQAS